MYSLCVKGHNRFIPDFVMIAVLCVYYKTAIHIIHNCVPVAYYIFPRVVEDFPLRGKNFQC